MNKPDKEIIMLFQNYLSTGDDSLVNELSPSELELVISRQSLKGINDKFLGVMFRKLDELKQKELSRSHDIELEIKHQSEQLKLKEQRKHESRIRASQYIIRILIGLIITGLATFLFIK